MGIIMKNGVCYSNGGDATIQPVIYSDTEREVGVWRDGKPLYQITKIYQNVSISTNSYTTLESAWGMELIHAFGFLVENGKRYAIPETSIRIEVDSSGSIICVSKTSSWNGDFYVTFQYTKPTDTPGSGTWTPSGVPAVHYSTDEQVVGTWVDGKTLYQKTLTYQNIQFNSSGYCDIDLSTENTSLILAVYDASYYIWTYNSVELRRSFERIAVEDDHVLLIGPASRNIDDAYVTIRYTKITTP